MKRILYLILLVGLICPSCAPTYETQTSKAEEVKKVFDSWMGIHKSQLIKSWGAPTRTVPDGNGGEILVYESSKTAGTVVYGYYMQKTAVDFKEMFADKNGKLYYYRYGRR